MNLLQQLTAIYQKYRVFILIVFFFLLFKFNPLPQFLDREQTIGVWHLASIIFAVVQLWKLRKTSNNWQKWAQVVVLLGMAGFSIIAWLGPIELAFQDRMRIFIGFIVAYSLISLINFNGKESIHSSGE